MTGTRRDVLRAAGLAAAGLTAGCGFRPLYMPVGGGRGAAISGLEEVYVPVIPERTGQLLRQALQQRMNQGSGIAKKYDLITAPAISGEALGVQTDSASSRIRLNATANWTLRRLDLAHTPLASGSSRITDGYNIINAQYFAADLENEAADRRIADALADQIVQQLAVWFRRQAPPAPPPPG